MDLTADEWAMAEAGYQQRILNEWERTAALAAWIRQASGAKETADKLLGTAFTELRRRRKRKPQQESDED